MTEEAVGYMEQLEKCKKYLEPFVGGAELLIVAGSGLGGSVSSLLGSNVSAVKYTDIPFFPQTTVPGHGGELLIGLHSNTKVVVMSGRFHYYEGYSMQEITLPMRVFGMLGVRKVVLTNACGGISKHMRTGDVMVIEDHVALPCMAGLTPLRGPNILGGDRFLPVTHLWSHKPIYQQLVHEYPDHIKHGVYGFIAGPQFETPAEVKMLRLLGIDVVGMSTVPEAIVAKHSGMQVVGLSLVTNECVDLDKESIESVAHEPTHKEVLDNSAKSAKVFTQIITSVVSLMSNQ